MKNKVINVNNPTQININTQQENSVTTIGKLVEGMLTPNFLDSFILSLFKNIVLFIKSAVFPFIVLIAIFPAIWATMQDESISYAYIYWFDGSPGSLTWLFGKALPRLFNAAFGLIIIEGIIFLFGYWILKRYLMAFSKRNKK